MIRRSRQLRILTRTLRENPIAALLGPRQCGKTTLARQLAARRKRVHFFDLELPADKARLGEPELALSPLEGLVVLDEIQSMPRLFELLRPLADRPGRTTRFLILGSASPDLVRGVSQTLAGRVGFLDLGGLDMAEVGAGRWRELWFRGGFPRSLLADDDEASLRWRTNFIRTFLERDIPRLGLRLPPEQLRRFWLMVAHYHGQIWSAAEIARSLGVSEHTVRGYLDFLAGTFLVRLLPPWFENLGKRQIKRPKVYIRDSGILHALLGLGASEEVQAHPKLGASWEGFALEQVLSLAGGHQAFFWATHAGAELDLLLLRGGRRFGVEFKWADAPRMTRSLAVALDDLQLERAWIVHPGEHRFPLHERVEALPLYQVAQIAKALGG